MKACKLTKNGHQIYTVSTLQFFKGGKI